MTISIQPKGDFLKDKTRASKHQDVMANPEFRENCKVALLEMQLAMPVDGQSILKLKGAKEFLDILLNLGEPSVPFAAQLDKPLNPI